MLYVNDEGEDEVKVNNAIHARFNEVGKVVMRVIRLLTFNYAKMKGMRLRLWLSCLRRESLSGM